MNSDTQVLLNVIDMLTICLEFYGNEDNHKNGLVDKDSGSHAQSILEIVKKNRDEFNLNEIGFDKIIKNELKLIENEKI